MNKFKFKYVCYDHENDLIVSGSGVDITVIESDLKTATAKALYVSNKDQCNVHSIEEIVNDGK